MAKRTCSIEGCDNVHYGRGWCSKHWNRWRRHGDPLGEHQRPTLAERVFAKVEKQPNGCWHFTGWNSSGYGRIGSFGETQYVHRWSYEHHVGPIPDGYDIDHLCHNRDPDCLDPRACLHRRCLNPDHLEAVPHQVNMSRGKTGEVVRAMAAARTTCRRGHPYTDENTYIMADGNRACRTCKRMKTRESQRRRARRKREGS